MKPWVFLALLSAAVVASGCALHERGLVLDPIGPAGDRPAPSPSNGVLVVFSAFEATAHFNSRSPYRAQYTDYKLFSEGGQFLKTVHNDNGLLVEGPREVKLPAGAYRVVARANGYGLVTVPVIIVENRVTTVHLEGSSSEKAIPHSNPVRLPDGEIAGWRAGSQSSTGR